MNPETKTCKNTHVEKLSDEIIDFFLDDERIKSIISPYCSCGKQMTDNYSVKLGGEFTIEELKTLVNQFEQKKI